MPEIKVEVSGLNIAIQNLQRLSMDMGRSNIKAPVIVGGGRVVNELENISNTYKSIDAHLAALISNTIALLRNARDSYTTADTQAANGISHGGK